jgi:hypothetical protein
MDRWWDCSMLGADCGCRFLFCGGAFEVESSSCEETHFATGFELSRVGEAKHKDVG